MRQHNHEQRQILQRVPGNGGVPAFLALDFNGRDQKPGPMQKDVNSRNAKEMDGTLIVLPFMNGSDFSCAT
jgi:hypothetical protein